MEESISAPPRRIQLSNLARGGIVLYVLVQRALEQGSLSLTSTSDFVANHDVFQEDASAWTLVAGETKSLSTEYGLRSGVYSNQERLAAVNRPTTEDQTLVVPDEQLTELFQGLSSEDLVVKPVRWLLSSGRFGESS